MSGMLKDARAHFLKMLEQFIQEWNQINSGEIADESGEFKIVASRAYRTWQRNLVLFDLHAIGKTWCTMCGKTVESKQTRFILLKGRRVDTSISWILRRVRWDLQDFIALHRACLSCFDAAMARSPEITCESVLLESETLNAYPVEFRNGLFFYKRDGLWLYLSDETSASLALSDEQADQLARELGLPFIEFPKNSIEDMCH
ncbi:MAG: hypothetical protein WC477_05825 [Patescibacteria group bacterium]